MVEKRQLTKNERKRMLRRGLWGRVRQITFLEWELISNALDKCRMVENTPGDYSKFVQVAVKFHRKAVQLVLRLGKKKNDDINGVVLVQGQEERDAIVSRMSSWIAEMIEASRVIDDLVVPCIDLTNLS